MAAGDRASTDIDRLIEEGLALYGKGDLDGALHVWEKALAIEPDNPQATSYVEYVQENYELLTNPAPESSSNVGSYGFEEDDYQVEIVPGEIQPATAMPGLTDPVDEGWVLDGEGSKRNRSSWITGDPGHEVEMSIEAGEPPDVTFEDNTREYFGGRPATRDMAVARDVNPRLGTANEFPLREVTPAFGSPQDVNTPNGFGAQLTDVRKRDLGFVKTTQSSSPPPVDTRGKRTSAPPELKMTLRTPDLPLSLDPIGSDTADITLDRGQPSLDLELDPIDLPTIAKPAADAFELAPPDLKPRTRSNRIEDSIANIELDPPPELGHAGIGDDDIGGPTTASRSDNDFDEPQIEILPQQQEPDDSDEFAASVETKDLPSKNMLSLLPDSKAPTRDISGAAIPPSKVTTRDLALPQRAPARPSDAPFVTSQPTRDLGLRPAGPTPTPTPAPAKRAPTNLDDEPTTQQQIRQLEKHHQGAPMLSREPTRTVQGADPVEAQCAAMLAEIDRGAPFDETRDERTRRRISGLLEHAATCSKTNDLDRAVTAVDLALDEDASSALAQKLVHRNRDAIMGVFQTYLGDLQRQPVLARPLHELATAPINPRAAFLLSRVDGVLSLDEILDVSGMPRLEAYRYLCQLYLRGILR